jgi:predicted phosphodiesterase
MSYTKEIEKRIIELCEYDSNNSNIAKKILQEYQIGKSFDAVRIKVASLRKERPKEIDSITQEKEFVASAWDDEGRILTIEEYCEKYNFPLSNVKSYKLVTHTGTPYYNVLFKENCIEVDSTDYIGILEKEFEQYRPFQQYEPRAGKIGVITLTDFHFGAYISAMKNTPEFSISILCEMLSRASDEVNRFKYTKVHVHILGDLIESFTGLNHKNSWKGLDKGMFGVKAIKLFVKLFIEHFLVRVENLGSIKIVAGNHDRVTSSNDEDTDGGAAELIAWGLEAVGYDVEFSTSVIKHVVEGVCYILNHGHHDYTKKKTTQEMCWMFGEKGHFNFIMEGHLHSRISKLNASQIKNFELIKDDSIDCRRQVCPSLFTGNSYSEYGGWSTTAGFLITESNDNKGVNVFDFSI